MKKITLCLAMLMALASSSYGQHDRKNQFFIAPELKNEAHRLYFKLKPSFSNLSLNELNSFQAFNEVTHSFNLKVSPGIQLPERELIELEKSVAKRSGKTYGLRSFFQLNTQNLSSEQLLKLAYQIEQLEEVEYVELIPQKRPAPPADPLESRQAWAYPDDNVYNGHDFQYAWSINALGQGVTVRDIEYGWNTQHEDLRNQPIRYADGLTQITYTGNDIYSYVEHGTCIAGIICAEADNDIGIKGGAPSIKELVLYPEETVEFGWDRLTSYTRMVSESQPGDILLLEIQMYGPNNQYVPAEYSQSIWDLTRLAVDKGVIVIATGGNGGENLDAPEYEAYMKRGNSGAIMVGAGISTNFSRWSQSTYGSRFDIQCWGGAIFTTGEFNGNGVQGSGNTAYTGSFGGTSGAGGLAAAIAAVTQSYARQQLGRDLAPWEMRKLLVENAAPQGGNTNEHIGPMPVLQRVLKSLDSYSPAILVKNGIDDQTIGFSSTKVLDLSNVFEASGDISLAVTQNISPEIASVELSGSSLTIQTNDIIGSTYIQVSGTYQGEIVYEDFLVHSWDQALERVHHDGENNIGIGWGDLGAAEFIVATRLTSDELSAYYGHSRLAGIQFYISGSGGSEWTSIKTRVYSGDENGPSTLLFESSEIGSTVKADNWNYFLFDENEEIDLNSGTDYFIGYYIHETKGYPCGVDAGPAIYKKGDWANENNSGWVNMSIDWKTDTYDWNFNFNIRPLIRDLTVGIASESPELIRIFPNPSNGLLNVNVDFTSYRIHDLNGRLVQSSVSRRPIDISDLNKGVYMLSLELEDGTQVMRKVLKN